MEEANHPSYFELLAALQVVPMFRDASRHAAAMASARWPERLGFLARWHEELFHGLLLVVEAHYLKHYQSTFAESFGGLTRVRLRHRRSAAAGSGAWLPAPLDARGRWASLAAAVLLPYLKAKADLWYRRRAEETARRRSARGGGDDGRVLPASGAEDGRLVRAYPYLHAAYEGAFLLFAVLYMFGYTPFFSPPLHAMGVKVVRMEPEALQLQNLLQFKSHFDGFVDVLHSPGPVVAARRLAAWLWRLALDNVHNLLTVLSFVLRVLYWWYQAQSAAGLGGAAAARPGADIDAALLHASAAASPPPPQPATPVSAGFKLPESPSVCPLCLRQRSNPAAAPSGYVFCYPCLHQYVESLHRCPITHLPCSIDQIRKLYL